MTHTLIATVGKSPGAITGMYKALIEQDPPTIPERIHLIRTEGDPDIADAADIIRRYLARYDVEIISPDYRIPHIDVDNRRAANAFQKLVADAVERHAKSGENLLLNITGGRSSMGAMLAVAGHVYSDYVAGMYHLWVTTDVEDLGTVKAVRDREHSSHERDRADIERGLFPSKEQCHLVSLSVFDLSFTRTWVAKLSSLEAYYEEREEQSKRLVKGVLTALPGRMTGEDAVKFYELLRDVLLDKQSLDTCYSDMIQLLQNTGLLESVADIASWFDRLHDFDLAHPDAADHLVQWLEETQARSATRWWKDKELRAEFRQELKDWLEIAGQALEIAGQAGDVIRKNVIIPGLTAYALATQVIDIGTLLQMYLA